MNNPVNKCWLGVEITPVQSFIEAARSVRDLQTGSLILSLLSSKSLEAGVSAGGRAVFPEPSMSGGMPNRFTLCCEDAAAAERAEKACRIAVETFWEELFQKVHSHIDSKLNGAGKWDAFWDEQVKGYWAVKSAIVGTDDLASAGAIRVLAGLESGTPFQKQWCLLSTALALQKQVRPYPAGGGIGRDKCTLFGDREQMGPGGTLQEQAAFWSTARKKLGHTLRESDRLCAVALVKRLAPWVSEVKELKQLSDSTPDTSVIALRAWFNKCEDSSDVKPSLDDWRAKSTQWSTIIKDDDARHALLLDGRTADELVKVLELSDEEIQCAKPVATSLVAARSALLQAAKKTKIGAPPRYLALIKLDGDRIGERLEAAKDEDALKVISKALTCYAASVRNIVETHHGTLVYAGGDDALALLPLSEAIPCANALRDAFPNLPGVVPSTASAGLVVFHHKYPLREALHQARAAEHKAKDDGRNALGWVVIKRGGGPLSGVVSWELSKQVHELAKAFSNGQSDRWLHHVDKLATEFPKVAPLVQAKLLLQHHLKRMADAADSADSRALEKTALGLFDAVCDDRDKRKRDAGIADSLELFVQLGLWAAFIARGQRED